MRQRDKERAIKAILKAKEMNQQLKTKYANLLRKELKDIGKKVVDEWYSNYTPNIYDRQYSLEKAFKVSVSEKKGTYSVTFSSAYMKGYSHFTGKKTKDINEYIYDISFIQGWHGGANKGENHPFPGIPFYREPYPYYTQWYYAAESSFSPYEKMTEEMSKKIEELGKQYDDEFEKEVIDRIKHHIQILKGGAK